MAVAKAMLDRIHADLPADPSVNDTNSYVLGSLNSHNVVLAYPPFGMYGRLGRGHNHADARELQVHAAQTDSRHVL